MRVTEENFRKAENLLLLLVLAVVLVHALDFWLSTYSQPLIDQHSFRQTQTALSTFYLFADGKNVFQYETPVIGYPWAVPFEFPSYQFVVYCLQSVSGLELGSAGRSASIIFGLASMLTAVGLLRLLQFPRNTQIAFAVLFLASPVYLYWNRTFMIESMTLFLTLAALYCYVKSRLSSSRPSPLRDPFLRCLLFLLCLALITKITTSFAVFAVIGLDQTYMLARKYIPARQVSSKSLGWHCSVLAILALSFLLLLAWTQYTDTIKNENPIGSELTSARLSGWNFGNLKKLLSAQLWIEVVYNRMLTPGGFLPALCLVLSGIWISRKSPKNLIVIATCLILAAAPIVVFSNLHQVHNYYQSANQIFLLLALAIAGTLSFSNNPFYQLLRYAFFVIFLFSGYQYFSLEYLPATKRHESRAVAVAHAVKDATTPTEAIVVFGFDWNSTIAYHSQRRSLSVPNFIQKKGIFTKDDAFSGRRGFLGEMPLGAIINPEPLDQTTVRRACRSTAQIPELKVASSYIYDCAP